MDELDPRLRSLLAAARDEHDPDDHAAPRVRAAIAAALEGAAGEGGHGVDAGKRAPVERGPRSGAAGGASVVKWLGVLLIAGGLATFGALQLRSSPLAAPARPRPAPAERAQPSAALAPEPPPAASLAPPALPTAAPAVALPPAERVRAQRAPRKAALEAGSRVATAVPAGPSELVLIRGATSALRDGRARDALHSLEQHAHAYPEGMLREERQGLRVLALCALGSTAQGRTERERFLSTAAHSPLAGRVRAACAEPEAP